MMRPADQIRADANDVRARYANTPLFRIAGDALDAVAEVERLAEFVNDARHFESEYTDLAEKHEALFAEVERLTTELADYRRIVEEAHETVDRFASRSPIIPLSERIRRIGAERDVLRDAVAKVLGLCDNGAGSLPLPSNVPAVSVRDLEYALAALTATAPTESELMPALRASMDAAKERRLGTAPKSAPEPVHVLTDDEFKQLKAAFADPDYVRRLAADAERAGMVEVDNPLRRELRPRRGAEPDAAVETEGTPPKTAFERGMDDQPFTGQSE